MRRRILCVIIMSFNISLLSACSTSDNIVGKYEADWDETIYYEYREDGTYTTNNLLDSEDTGEGVYTIDENNYIITYINGDDNRQNNIGYIYENYICTMFIGEMPTGNNEVILTDSLSVGSKYRFKIEFNQDNYRYIFVNDSEEHVISEGTFYIDNKVINCNAASGQEVKLFLEDNVLYSVEYNKVN